MDRITSWIDRAFFEQRDVLIGTDFDGTLTDVVVDRGAPLLGPRARAALTTLTGAPRTHVAILSGRTRADLAPRVTGLGPVWLASDHGGVVIEPNQETRVFDEETPADRLTALHARADKLARVFRGARVELKSRSVALHYREVEERKHDALIEMFRLAIVTQQARVLPGRKVIEGTFGGGDKGTALAYIRSRLPEGTAVLYVGDDTTDEPALAYAHNDPLGLALHVQSYERVAPRVSVNGWLSNTTEWLEILEILARLRGKPISAACSDLSSPHRA